MKSQKNPGKIYYYENKGSGEILVETCDVKEVPESMRFVEVNGKRIPVVKVVMLQSGDFKEIIEYGPKEKFLRSTIAASTKK